MAHTKTTAWLHRSYRAVAPEAVSAPEDPEEMMGVDYSKASTNDAQRNQSLRARSRGTRILKEKQHGNI